jgi:YidC/Oxa1 family membrane protein insertase
LRAAAALTGPSSSDAVTSVSRILPLLPFGVLVAAAVLPLAAGLYLVTSLSWSTLEQAILRRRYPMPGESDHPVGSSGLA